MPAASQTHDFYPSMLRNLRVLRDIHRIITEARARQQRVIMFRDEQGALWQLARVGDDHHKPHQVGPSSPARRQSA